MEQSELSRQARRSYEGARLRTGLLWALPLTMLTLVSVSESHEHLLTVLVAAFAVASMTLLVKKGGPLGSGARMGLLAGLVPFIVSMLARDSSHIVTRFGHVHGCVLWCAGACAVMTVALSRTAAGRAQWLAATWTMLTVAIIACSCVGATGVALLVAMVVIVVMPVRLFVRAVAR